MFRNRSIQTAFGVLTLAAGSVLFATGGPASAVTAADITMTAVQCPGATPLPTATVVNPTEIPSGCVRLSGLGYVMPTGTFVTGGTGQVSAPAANGTFTVTPVPSGPQAGGTASMRCTGDTTGDTDPAETLTLTVGSGTIHCIAYYLGEPNVTVTKTGPSTAAVGSTVTYTITIENTGQGTYFNAVLNDVATGLGTATIVSQPQYLIDAGQSCTGFPCPFWFLNPGAKKVFVVSFVVPPCPAPTSGSATNVAAVSGSAATVSATISTTITGCTVTTTTQATTTTTQATTTTTQATTTTTQAATTTTAAATTTTTTTTTPAGVVVGATTTTTPAATTTPTTAPATGSGASSAAAQTATTTAKPATTTTAVPVDTAPPIVNVEGRQVNQPIAFTGPSTARTNGLLAGILLVLGMILIVSAQMPRASRRRR